MNPRIEKAFREEIRKIAKKSIPTLRMAEKATGKHIKGKKDIDSVYIRRKLRR